MFRNLFRRAVPVLVLLLTLAGAVPAVAQSPGVNLWDGAWRWVVSFWWDGEDDRGAGLDPNGSTTTSESEGESEGDGDRGAGADPNG